MRTNRNAIINRLLLFAFVGGGTLASMLFGTIGHALSRDRAISQYAHSAWRLQDGYFSGRVNAIAQTTDGYLWIGTRGGLLRFDGIRFVPWIQPLDKFPQNNIHALLGSSDGSLWIGIRSGLFRWKDQRLIRITGISGPVNEILEDSRGRIWVALAAATRDQGPLCRVDADHGICLNRSDGMPSDIEDGESLRADAEGNIWMGTQNALLQWKDGKISVRHVHGLDSNNSAGIDALAPAGDGSLWVGMAVPGNGLGLERLDEGKWKKFDIPQLQGSALPVTDLFSDRSGALWIGTADRGIYRYATGRIDHFGQLDGLSSDFVSRFFQDREGTVWVITSQGIDCFHDLNVVTWSKRQGLTTDNVVSVAADQHGGVWVGNAGGLDSIRQNIVTSIRSGSGLPGNQVRALYEDRKGRLWLGIDNELMLFEDNRFRRIRRANGSPSGPINSIVEDTDGNIWADSYAEKNLLMVSDMKVEIRSRNLEIDSSHAMATAPDGSLWLGLMSGDLAHFKNGQSEVIPFPHTQQSRVRQVISTLDGTVMAATSFGLLVWRSGKAMVLGIQNGLPCEEVNGFSLDEHANLWLHSICGMIEIQHDELEHWISNPLNKVQSKSFDVFDGALPGNAFYQPATTSSDGRLWFATGSVLQMIDPANLIHNLVLPPVHVEEIIANRKHYLADRLVQLPVHTRDVEIDYTALSFASPREVRFRYRLIGHDREWQEAGTRRQAFYTDLPPGNYQFHVIACNNDGLWNETGASISFLIVPAIYQTPWFRVLCLLTAGCIFWMWYLLHLKRMTRRIEVQLATRMEERERIARELHDTLLQGFQGLMLRFQSALKNIPPQSPSRHILESALDRADEVLLEGRQRVYDLRDGNLTGDSLWSKLVQSGKELAQEGSTAFSASVLGTHQPLHPTVCNEIFLIGREALTNAFRHAGAVHIEMEITYAHRKVSLVVRDDGVGMDKTTIRSGRAGHWGLLGMRERAQKIGARLTIWSNIGAGTEIYLVIPAKLAHHAKRNREAEPF